MHGIATIQSDQKNHLKETSNAIWSMVISRYKRKAFRPTSALSQPTYE